MIEVGFEEREGGLIIIPGMKRLDALVASEFRDLVAQKVGAHRAVVLALGKVSFVDSSGLAALISLLKRMPAGVPLRLCQVAESVQHLLKVTRLEKIFPVFADIPDALRG